MLVFPTQCTRELALARWELNWTKVSARARVLLAHHLHLAWISQQVALTVWGAGGFSWVHRKIEFSTLAPQSVHFSSEGSCPYVPFLNKLKRDREWKKSLFSLKIWVPPVRFSILSLCGDFSASLKSWKKTWYRNCFSRYYRTSLYIEIVVCSLWKGACLQRLVAQSKDF